MARRFPVPSLAVGMMTLDMAQSRHLRDVLRLRAGDAVELFEPAGQHATATVVGLSPQVTLAVEAIESPAARRVQLTIAAATPKGSRADWMVEKLSELEVAAFIPLESARTVVHPESGKQSRWERLASESAKQCRRQDVMRIEAPTSVTRLCASAAHQAKWCLSTETQSSPAIERLATLQPGELLAVVGPEGGWTDAELAGFNECGFQRVALTRTILRIETAAIATAALVMASAAAGEKERPK